MSQLSVADFFNQAKENEAVTPNRPPVSAVKIPATTRNMFNVDTARKQFISLFLQTGRHLRRWEVFSDFLSLAASELWI